MLESILLQAAGKPNTIFSILLWVGIFVVFYFFMIRPQQKKAKEQKLFKESLKKGDSVVTIGGLHGKIVSLESNDTVVVEVDKGVKLTFDRTSISAEATKRVQAAEAK